MHRYTKPLLAAFATACLATACSTTPPPAPEPAPPAPASFDHTLSGDALFAFGKASVANLSDAGRAELDALAARVLATPGIDMVHVIGHSDRIGNATVNQRISQQRADSVAEYLSSKGVYPELISTEGRGASEPLVDCDKERGQRLIECLAPNRRVEIQVQFGS